MKMRPTTQYAWYNDAQPLPPPGPDIEGAMKSNVPQTKTERQKIFAKLATTITEAKRAYRGNTRHDVVKAARTSNIYTNSVAILTGAQSSGKTFTALAESVIICQARLNTHMLIFIKKKVFDPTVEFIKPLMEKTGCKCVEIEYDEAEKFSKIFHYKNIYNKVKRAIAFKHTGKPLAEFDEDLTDATDEEVANMFNALQIEDLKHDWLNTIICFDDSGYSGLFKNPASYFNERLKLCRDDNVIYFLTVHGITQLSPSIKQNTATVFVFKGLSKERLQIIWRQLNIMLDWGEFRGCYYAISHTAGARYMVVDNIAGTDPKIE
jgi:hypothetical protein